MIKNIMFGAFIALLLNPSPSVADQVTKQHLRNCSRIAATAFKSVVIEGRRQRGRVAMVGATGSGNTARINMHWLLPDGDRIPFNITCRFDGRKLLSSVIRGKGIPTTRCDRACRSRMNRVFTW